MSKRRKKRFAPTCWTLWVSPWHPEELLRGTCDCPAAKLDRVSNARKVVKLRKATPDQLIQAIKHLEEKYPCNDVKDADRELLYAELSRKALESDK